MYVPDAECTVGACVVKDVRHAIFERTHADTATHLRLDSYGALDVWP